MVAPTKRVNFDTAGEGSDATTLFDASGGTGTLTAKGTSWIRGSKGCEVAGNAVSIFGSLTYAASVSTAGAQIYFTIGTAPAAANVIMRIRNSTADGVIATISTSNVLTVTDAASATIYTSTSALSAGDYVLTMVAVKGATTSTGRILVWLRDNGDTLVSSGTAQPVDTGTTVNTGTADFTVARFGKTSSTGNITYDMDECATSEGSLLEIDLVSPNVLIAGKSGYAVGSSNGAVVSAGTVVEGSRVGYVVMGCNGATLTSTLAGAGDHTTVEIAFNVGFGATAASRTWTDVSSYVELADLVAISRGREDEFGTTNANSLSLTLDNRDGRFTAGRAASPYYPNVKVGRPIRVTNTTDGVSSVRFLGFIDSWPVAWDGTDVYAKAQISATSRMARLGTGVELRSPFEEERLSDDPSSLYTLGEPSDSTAASDTSSNNRQQLVQVGAGTAVVFGNATGPGTDGLTAAEFAAGKYLRASDTFYSTTVGYTLHCFVNCSATATDSLIAGFGDETAGSSASLAAGYWALAVGSTGKLVLRNPAGGGTILLTSTTTIEDGATHAVAVVDDVAAGTVKLYVDGIEEASGVSPDALVSPTRLFVGPAFTGSVAHVTTGPPTSQPRLAAYSQAGLTGFAGDTPAERLARYVSYGAIYDSVSFEIGSATLSHIDINGVTALDAMRKVEATEGGVLFDGKDGSLVFHGRSHRYGATSAFTISTALQTVGSGIQPTLDRSALRNDVTAALADGTVTAPFSDQASIADYGLARESLELHTSDPDAPIAAATWLVNSYKEPGVRIGSLEVDLMGLIGSAYGSGPYGSGPYGGSAAFEALLAADIGTRFTLADMPTQNAETSTDYFIEGYTETIGVGTWTMTLNVSPARVYDVFTIDDPVLGQIDGPYLIAR